jgi:geranylgeranyl diphosphate synthase type II
MRSMAVDVKLLTKEAAELTDRALEELIPSIDTIPSSIHGAMRHSTFAGGKRCAHCSLPGRSHHCRNASKRH